MKIAVLGLTITSSWGNGHATTFRSLLRALHARGHDIVFLEKDVEWYRSNRDLPEPDYCEVLLYGDWNSEGRPLALAHCKSSDVVVIGSYFPDAITATTELLFPGKAPLLFYDIDTPITVSQLRRTGHTDYLDAAFIPHYAAYLSFTSGPILEEIRRRFRSPLVVPLHCSVDPDRYHRTPVRAEFDCDLSYLGTYASDRQPKLTELLQSPATMLPEMSFLVAGPQYPATLTWSRNIVRIVHVPPIDHAALYSSSRFTLNITRKDMVTAGYSPSVRLFEAAACGTPILSDFWMGMEAFLEPGREVLLPRDAQEVRDILTGISDEEARRIGERGRERILSMHTADHRAREFEAIVERIYSSTELPDSDGKKEREAAAV